MDAVDSLIVRNGLTDTTPEEPGRFSIPDLQTLHDQLVAQGSRSLTDALQVGVLVEETDIADLKEALANAQDAALQRVFGNLLRASGQHLAAFQTALGLSPSNDSVGSSTCPRSGACASAAACDRASTPAGKGTRGRRGGSGNPQGAGAGNGTCNGTGAGTCTGTGPQEDCPNQVPAPAAVPAKAPQTRRGR